VVRTYPHVFVPDVRPGQPIALFYMQGLNTTTVHAHGAFFGVYGMLGLGLTLMCLRALQADREWYSRSSEFLDQGLMQTLRWLRMPRGHAVRDRRGRLRDLRLRPALRILPQGQKAARGRSRRPVGPSVVGFDRLI
jgi:hypothetical protein